MDYPTFFMFKQLFPFLKHIFIFTFFIESALSVHPLFEACKPQGCRNGPNISYPFWIYGYQEDHCGYPGFGVSCKNDEPTLRTSGNYYTIQDIFYKNHSFQVSIAQAMERSCPLPLLNFTFDRAPFEFGTTNADLFFYYNCTTVVPNKYSTYPIRCATNAAHHSFAVFVLPGEWEQFNYSSSMCESVVGAPVKKNGLRSFQTTQTKDYVEFLRNGFILEWVTTPDNCTVCQESGGHCGFYEKQFMCFCPDQPHFRSCYNESKTDLKKKKLIIGFSIGAGGILLTCFFGLLIYGFRNKKLSSIISQNISSNTSSKSNLENTSTYLGLPIFTYKELEDATDNFNPSKELGDGGFGSVYHGKLQDGRIVAVKRLYENNYKRVEQFINEVDILTRLRHQNLVSLYGCTSRHSHGLLLVYEFIPNGTVADHLYGDRAKAGSLTWPIRMSIAIETASALAYLHASDIIHRDVKTNNILLDNNFCVKVADFGLSRLFPTDVTHVSTGPQGTPGYVDPEYHQCYQLTNKSDVYSFGVVLIELISSMPAVDINRHEHEINLAKMATNRIQNHLLHELVDPGLRFEEDSTVRRMIEEVAQLAFQCLQHEKWMRPTMNEVLEKLKEIESEKFNVEKTEKVDILADDVGLLKNSLPLLSPDSVADKWISGSTTRNASG